MFDAENGQHYNYFRDYAPGLGRYIESDPIGLIGGMNLYAYVAANPLRFSDPIGWEPQRQWDRRHRPIQQSAHFGVRSRR